MEAIRDSGGEEHKARVRELLTPEGIPLRVVVADAGSRGTALAIDLVLMFAGLAALSVLFSLAFGAGLGEGWLMAFVQLAAFLIFNFYFVFFEVRWQGATPGKRKLGLRVIDAEGGQLTSGAILGRNLVRNVELWIPISILVNPAQSAIGGSGVLRVLSVLWVLGILFLPLFNRDRLRVGDLVGGTMVVLAPSARLLPDVGAETDAAPESAAAAAAAPKTRYTFDEEQLGVYGIYELQVLEKVLRGTESMEHEAAVDAVYRRIRKKINWDDGGRWVDAEQFLRDFYAALRAHLERKMLFGVRKKDKFSSR